MSNDKTVTDAEVTQMGRFLDSIGRGLTKDTIRLILEKVAAGRVAEQKEKFLCNGTRFKLAFLEDDDADGEPTVRVTALNNFQHELDGRWVALVPAEDDCHLVAAGRVAASTTPVSQPPERPTLREAADHFAEAGHEFWNACRRDAGGGAVRWLDLSDGTLIIFTRGEYRETLLAGVDAIPGETTVKFEDSSDEVDGMPAVIAAEKLPHSQAAEPAPPAETSQPVAQKADAPIATVTVSNDDLDMGFSEAFIRGDFRLPNGTYDLYTSSPPITEAERLDAQRYQEVRSRANSFHVDKGHFEWILHGIKPTGHVMKNNAQRFDAAIDAAMAAKDAA